MCDTVNVVRRMFAEFNVTLKLIEIFWSQQICEGFPIIIDNGSENTRAGFATCDIPIEFPTVVGYSKNQEFVGGDAQQKSEHLSLQYPMQCGIVQDWDDMTKIWHHTFHKVLKVDPKQHAVVLTESSLNPKANREKTTEIMFETFKIPAL